MRNNNLFYIFGILVFFVNNIFSQVILDPLSGSTSGTKVGGTFTADGYKPGQGENHILYKVPQQILNGYVEVQIKGFDFTDFQQYYPDVSTQTAFFVMYDGRGVNEPMAYSPDYRNNFFRWEVVYRSDKPNSTSGNRFKAKMHTAAETPERLNATEAWWETLLEGTASDWSIEPNGIRTSWDPNKWYTLKAEWDNTTKDFKVFRDGTEVWYNKKEDGLPFEGDSEFSSTSPYPWYPVDFRIWLGSGPRQYDNKMPDLVFRNFKVVDLGGTTVLDTLLVSPTSTSISSIGGSTSFGIIANIDWTVTSNDDWISLLPSSGSNDNTFIATYQENFSNNERIGQIEVKGNGIVRLITITQSGAPLDYIIINPKTLNVDFTSGSGSLDIESNVSWSATSDSEWLSVSTSDTIGNSSLTINYLQNNSNNPRSAMVIVSNDSLSANAIITQSGSSYYININPKTWSVSRNSGTVTFNVESNHQWSLITEASWVTPSLSDTNGNASFSVNFQANLDTNQRTAVLYIESEYILDSVSVVQEEGKPIVDVMMLNNKLTNYHLGQNYPNPFNPSTTIDFVLPESGYTELVIFNSLGQEVKRLISSFISKGFYSKSFNATGLSTGIYFYTLKSGNYSSTKRMLLLE